MNNFEKISENELQSVGVTLHQYVHRITDARHMHLETADENNAFMVAFPTLSDNSTGVAHILEHTALCGSERYPVRDPFFMMLRRSLNTYMNAFTAADTTAYPFATRNKKDFYNLLSVYLDAVFFPNLHPLDFAQEGWRLEYAEDEKNQGNLVYHGVVYNEMKGAMSSPLAQLWNHLHAALFPDTIYAHNSGGDPIEITKLKHTQLCEFHSRYYNPTNAVFMTYGDLCWMEHQVRIEELVLNRFDGISEIVKILPQKPFDDKIEIEVAYQTTQVSERSTHAIWGWVCGSSTDSDALMEMHFLASVLLDHSGSPLRKLLETLETANSPSEICGVDDSTRQIIFVCGVEGTDDVFIDEIESSIIQCLRDIVDEGISRDTLQAAIDRLELEQRDWGGGTYPLGLSLMGRMLSSVICHKDPVEILDLAPALERLSDKLRSKDYFVNLINKVFLNNAHRARVIMRATDSVDPAIDNQQKYLVEMLKQLKESELEKIKQDSESLRQRQTTKDDDSLLPKVTLSDIPKGMKLLKPEDSHSSEIDEFDVKTNGIFRIRIAYKLPCLTKEELEILPIWTSYIDELGCEEDDYAAVQDRRSRVGEFSASCIVKPNLGDSEIETGFLILNGKGLVRKRDEVIETTDELVKKVRFDERQRLKELLYQSRAEAEQSLTARGHYLAMLCATKNLSKKGMLDELWDGGTSILATKKLASEIEKNSVSEHVFELFESIRCKILGGRPKIMLMAEGNALNGASEVCRAFRQSSYEEPTDLNLNFRERIGFDAWLIDSRINFCAMAFPAVSESSEDASSLAVLGKYLQDGFLHSEIREKGGAYGSGAGYFSDSRAFKFFSFRDPRLLETIEDFRRSIDWLSGPSNDQRLEEAILGTIRSLEPSRSPVAEADRAFLSGLFGRSDESIFQFRSRVLTTTHGALIDVAQKYLAKNGKISFVASKENLETIKHAGFGASEL